MGIVNKRNAVIGWLALKIGTRAAKRKAQAAQRRRARRALAGAVGAFGALLFWRKKRGGTAA